MDISVIIPVYKVEKSIERALRSLFSQTKTEGVEFIIVNDASPDSSIEIARRVVSDFPHCCIRIVEHSENLGVAAARSTGTKMASGEYIIHADSDDFFEPTMCEMMYNRAVRGNADIVFCDYWVNYYNGKQIYKKQNVERLSVYEVIIAMICGEIHGSLCNKLIHRDLYIQNGIDFEPNIDMWEDMLICVKLLLCKPKIDYLSQAFVHYVQHSDNSLTNNVGLKSLQSMILVTDKIDRLLRNSIMSQDIILPIMKLKMRVKKEWLFSTDKNIIERGCSLYSETDAYIKNYPNLLHRIILYGGRLKLIYCVALFSRLIHVVKKVRYKIYNNI